LAAVETTLSLVEAEPVVVLEPEPEQVAEKVAQVVALEPERELGVEQALRPLISPGSQRLSSRCHSFPI
jgi:hypothetical protein